MMEKTPLQWLKQQGGTGVFVKTKACLMVIDDELIDYKGGGRVFLAGGERAKFSPASILKLVKEGKAVRDGNRITLIDGRKCNCVFPSDCTGDGFCSERSKP